MLAVAFCPSAEERSVESCGWKNHQLRCVAPFPWSLFLDGASAADPPGDLNSPDYSSRQHPGVVGGDSNDSSDSLLLRAKGETQCCSLSFFVVIFFELVIQKRFEEVSFLLFHTVLR